MTDESWRHLEGTWDRLRWSRIRAKFERAGDAAVSMGMKEGTYRAYEREPGSSKHTSLDHQSASRFAKKFKVSWVWLLKGEGTPTDMESGPMERVRKAMDSLPEERQEEIASAIESLLRVAS